MTFHIEMFKSHRKIIFTVHYHLEIANNSKLLEHFTILLGVFRSGYIEGVVCLMLMCAIDDSNLVYEMQIKIIIEGKNFC